MSNKFNCGVNKNLVISRGQDRECFSHLTILTFCPRHLFCENYKTKTIWKIQMFVHVAIRTRDSMIIVNQIQHLTISSITHENIFPSFKCINHMVTKGVVRLTYINCFLARTKVNLRYLLLSQ